MSPRKKKSSSLAMDKMVEANKKSGGGFVLFTDQQGNVAAVSPTEEWDFERFVKSYLDYPETIPIGKDARGAWEYYEHEFTRDEAVARVVRLFKRLNRPIPPLYANVEPWKPRIAPKTVEES